MSYGLILWGNSTHGYYIFKLQKRIINIIVGAIFRVSRRELFKILKILTSQYIFSFAMFVVNNKGLIMENSELYNIKTSKNSNFYQPSSQLTISQKGRYYIGIKVYNKLTVQKKILSCSIKQF
jgi:hypothetical protein